MVYFVQYCVDPGHAARNRGTMFGGGDRLVNT